MRLVFPDQAPSRFTAALRSESARDLERRLQEPDAELPLPGEHARQLVGLIAELSIHDRRTRGHSERVRAYSDLIAAELNLSQDYRNKLHWGSLLHDVGKLLVAPEVLNATGRPSEEGWRQIREHPGHAEMLLGGMDTWLGSWVGAATEHHERWDGGGYPRGLKGDQITLAGRIVAVADAYDVMTSARSYKPALAEEAAREELARNAGSQFDPVVVRAFLECGLATKRRLPDFLVALGELPGMLSNVGSTVGTAGASVAVATASVVAPAVLPEFAPEPPAGLEMAAPVDHSGTSAWAEPIITTTSVVREAGTTSAPPPAPNPTSTSSTTTSSTTTTSTTTTVAPAPAISLPRSSTTTTLAPSPEAPPPPSSTTTTRSTTTTTTTAPPLVGAVGDSAATTMGKTVQISVVANDWFANGYQANSLQIVLPPTLGSAAAKATGNTNGRIQYQAGTVGTDSLVYRVCDSSGQCATALVTITIS